MNRNPVMVPLLVLCLLGCGTMSATTSESIGHVALAAAQVGAREMARAIDEAAQEETSPLALPEPRAEGDRLFVCWLDDYGGEELFAPTTERARDRCRAFHGQRNEPRHCICEAVQ
jgi:hypothetical protein